MQHMAQLFVGTSGWAYPSWKPDFYPEKLAQTKFLPYYASQLNTVEVNLTFRQLVKETTAQKWIAQTPEDFRFGVKAHQVHHAHQAAEEHRRIRAALSQHHRAAGAGGKLGPVLFQLPPNMKADPECWRIFLPRLPRALQAAFEFRHDSWFADDVFAC